VPIQQTLRHLSTAYKNFFEGRTSKPAFKKKKSEQSATFAANVFVWDSHTQNLSLAKMVISHKAFEKFVQGSHTTDAMSYPETNLFLVSLSYHYYIVVVISPIYPGIVHSSPSFLLSWENNLLPSTARPYTTVFTQDTILQSALRSRNTAKSVRSSLIGQAMRGV
jgi:hypothetical protein